MMHGCRFSCYAHILSNLCSYGVVAAGAGPFSPLDLAASPLAFQSHVTMIYGTFHQSRSSLLGNWLPIGISLPQMEAHMEVTQM
jgi:hypothetical protein